MIEINSSKIAKELLDQEIQKYTNSDNKYLKVRKKIHKRTNIEVVEPSLREHTSKIYFYLKKVEKLMHRLGFSKTTSISKKNINFKKTNIYLVSDFTKYYNEEFIKNVYLGVLKREVDPPSLEHYLNLLLSGQRSKTEILATIRFSKEGKAQNVEILGIKKRHLMAVLFRTPVLGYFAKLTISLLRLPHIVQNLNRIDAQSYQNIQNIQNQINTKVNISDFHSHLDTKVNISDFHSHLDTKVNLDDFHKDVFALETSISQNFDNSTMFTNQKFLDLKQQIQFQASELQNAKLYLREVEQNLQTLIQKAKETIDSSDASPKLQNTKLLEGIIEEKEHMLDSLYISFEDKFRGSRTDIKQRLEYYLPVVKEHLKDENSLAIDVGCGRGEWIELLKENSIKAKGIDLNRLMVKESLRYGLDAVYSDAIVYLKTLESDSIDLVSGFHIVEHLPFEILISLFDESFRVLKKGGMIIFETPNPENIMVGSCSFYTDPTHINPIPPVTLEFLAQNRGFSDVAIHRLHPLKEPVYIDDKNSQDINTLVFSSTKEQDYSIIGYK